MDLVTLALLKKLIEANNTIDYYDSKADLPTEGAINHLYKAGNALYEWDPVAKEYIALTADGDVLATLERQVAALKGAIVPDESNQTNDGYDLAYGFHGVTLPFNSLTGLRDESKNPWGALQSVDQGEWSAQLTCDYPVDPIDGANNKVTLYFNGTVDEYVIQADNPDGLTPQFTCEQRGPNQVRIILECGWYDDDLGKIYEPITYTITRTPAASNYFDQAIVGIRYQSKSAKDYRYLHLTNKSFPNLLLYDSEIDYADIDNQGKIEINYYFPQTGASKKYAPLALGYAVLAAGMGALSTGYRNVSIGNATLTSGYNNKNISDCGTVFGGSNVNYANLGFIAGGQFNTITARFGATILGTGNIHAGGSGTVIMGLNNIVSEGTTNTATLCAGQGNIVGARAANCFITGKENQINAAAAAVFGYNNIVTNDYAFVAGLGCTTSGWMQRVFGQWNSPGSNYIDIVGWGSSDTNRQNLYTLDKSGNAWYKGSITTPQLSVSNVATFTKDSVNITKNVVLDQRLTVAWQAFFNGGLQALNASVTNNLTVSQSAILNSATISSWARIKGTLTGEAAIIAENTTIQHIKENTGRILTTREYVDTEIQNVKNSIGNIEAILDEIIELQNGLMGEAILESIIDEQVAVIAAQEELIGGDSE